MARDRVTRHHVSRRRRASMRRTEYLPKACRRLADAKGLSYAVVLSWIGTVESAKLLMVQHRLWLQQPEGHHNRSLANAAKACENTPSLSHVHAILPIATREEDCMSAVEIPIACTRALRFMCRTSWAVSEVNRSESH